MDYTPHPTGLPDNTPAAFASPVLITMEGFNTNPQGMPDPWLPSGATETVGNNVDAYTDHTDCTVTAMTAAMTTGDADNVEGAAERIASGSPLGYAGFPEDIAAAAVFLASDEARYIPGHTLVVDAGQTTSGMVPNRVNIGSSRQFHEAGRVT